MRLLNYVFTRLCVASFIILVHSGSIFGQKTCTGISGKVFLDYNYDGIDNENGAGVAGVTVNLYPVSGALVSVSTQTDGTYAATVPSGGAYRVEFIIPNSLKSLKPTTVGADNGTIVQFITAPNCSANLGVSYPPDYCQANPPLIVPCYVNGNPNLVAGSAKDSAVLLSIPFLTPNGAPSTSETKLLKAKDIGATWGVGYDKTKKAIITTSVLHRHVGFTNAGAGAIYFIDYTNPSSANVLGSFSLSAGADPHLNLPSDPTLPSFDENAFGLVGKMSLGGTAVSDDDKKLYVLNLFDRKLYGIDLTAFNTSGTIPTAANITDQIAMPVPCGNAGVFRPWAVTCHQGKVYVGGVCSAEISNNANDLTAYVYVLNGAAWTQVFSIPLNYTRGYAANFAAGINSWLPWQDDYTKIPLVNAEFFINPQPILSDIEFDVDGSMVLGFTDRMGLQAGFRNYVPDATHTKTFILATAISAGDMVRVGNIAGTYILENGSTISTTGGKNNNQGPSKSEYYWSDYYTYQLSDATQPVGSFFQENTTGGLELIPGSGVVVSTLYAPLADANGAGISCFDNKSGARTKSFQIYTHGANNVGYFGKGSGLGDIKAACDAAPIQIGNRIWADCNGNGIQDADEIGLPNVNVSLFDANCKFIASTTSLKDGSYNFNNLTPNTNYMLVFGTSSQFSASKLNLGGVLYTLSPSKIGTGTNRTENDSDPTIGSAANAAPTCAFGLPFVNFTTQTAGCSDNSFDAGFVPPMLTLANIAITDENCAGANDGTIAVSCQLSGVQSLNAASVLEASIDGGLTFLSLNYQPTTNNYQLTFSNLKPASYHVIVRTKNTGVICGKIDVDYNIVKAGKKLNPPVIVADSVCQYSINTFNGGITAACDACPANLTPKIIWYDALGVQVATGSPFDPIKLKLVNAANPGSYTFSAVCQCGTGCLSDVANVIFKVIALPTPTISGNELPCPNETAIYTTANNAGSKYFWTLSSGGILTPNGNSATIKWNGGANSGPYTLSVKERNASGCDNTTIFIVNIKGVALSCASKINVSVDNNCTSVLNISDVLANTFGSSQMKIQLFWALNTPVLEEGVGKLTIDGVSANAGVYDFKNKTFVYKITENCSSNSCWGNILVEDKTPPVVTAPSDITVSCVQVGDANGSAQTISGSPTVSDCSTYSITFNDAFYDASCLTPYTVFPDNIIISGRTRPTVLPSADVVRIIVRNFIVTDKFGNNATAQQVIYVRKALLKNIICPSDFEIECKNYSSLSPATTGFPLLDVDGDFTTVYDRITLDKSACRMNTTYSDDTITLCANSFKVIRTWKILDWCAVDDPTTIVDERFKYCTQLIKVVDKTPPTTVAQFTQYYVYNGELSGRDTVANFDGVSKTDGSNFDGTIQDVFPQGLGTTCGASVRFVIRATDLYCTKGKVSISASDSRLKMLKGFPTYDAATGENLAIFEGIYDTYGDYSVNFYTSDACGYATSKKTFLVHVRDNIKPQPVCVLNTKVSLSSDGSNRVNATSFDKGSTDNCAIQQILVRRMFNCQNPSGVDFKDYVDFFCCDVAQTIQVVMRVYDYSGNYNDCMVNVLVEDKIKPSCVAPLDKKVACNTLDLNNLAGYGSPTLWDNCGVRDTSYSVSIKIDNCKLGTVTRSWIVTDNGGRQDSCKQIISTYSISDFTVDFPDDVVVDCFAAIKSIEQQKSEMLTNQVGVDGNILNNGCSVLAINIKDDTLTSVPGACYKILRRISVIDWCKYNPNNDAVDLNSNNYGQPVCGDAHSNAAWSSQNIPAWQDLQRSGCTTPFERRFRDADDLAGSGPANVNNSTHPWAYSDGIICFTQVIKVVDNTPPIITYCTKDTIINDFVTAGCKATATLRCDAQDLCNGKTYNASGFLRYNWTLFNVSTNSVVQTGVCKDVACNVATVSLDYNTAYELRWLVTDPCNNITRCTTAVKAVDAKKPSLVCKDVKAELMSASNGTASVNVWAKEILSSLEDNCTDLTTLTQSAVIERASDSKNIYPSTQNANIPMSCSDAGKTVSARVWIKDIAGNANYCSVNVVVQDNLNACAAVPGVATLSGGIKNEMGDAVDNVTVNASINGVLLNPITTGTSGNFAFSNLSASQKISTYAFRDDNVQNGVTTYDIALLSRHILDIQTLNSPYKIIAADVNKDGEVSALDMLIMRRLVLHLIPSFPNNTAWRFVDKNYVFIDPTNPFGEDFPEVVSSNIVKGVNTANFIGIKVGDVNNSAVANSGFNSVTARGVQTLMTLTTSDKFLNAGETTDIVLHADNFSVNGFQFTLNTSKDLEVIAVSKAQSETNVRTSNNSQLSTLNSQLLDISDNNFGVFPNAVTLSWDGKSTNAATDLVRITVRAKNKVQLSNVLSLSSNLTAIEAFDANGRTGNIVLNFLKSTPCKDIACNVSTFKLYQNAPNPFDSETSIGFDLPNDEPVKLTIANAQGQIVKVIEKMGTRGYNNISINKSDLLSTGIYFYRVDAGFNSKTLLMINNE